MKLAAGRIDAFLRRPGPEIRAVLVYGPEGGLVRERADTLVRGVVADLADPFRIAQLAGAQLLADRALLADEMAAIALTGGRRCVRVREAEEAVAPLFARLFEAMPPGDSLAVIEAGDLGKSSKLRALFEADPAAAAVPCYVEDEAALGVGIGAWLEEAGKQASAEALELLARSLVGDRRLARAEIDKLVTYLGDQQFAELADVEACIGDSGALELDAPSWSAGDGDYAGIDRALARLFGEGQSPVGLLRAAQRHFQRLHLVVAQTAGGSSLETAVGGLKPPLFFKSRNRFLGQARRWSPGALRQALDRLTETEIECKRTGNPDRTLCARAFYQIAALARGRGTR